MIKRPFKAGVEEAIGEAKYKQYMEIFTTLESTSQELLCLDKSHYRFIAPLKFNRATAATNCATGIFCSYFNLAIFVYVAKFK